MNTKKLIPIIATTLLLPTTVMATETKTEIKPSRVQVYDCADLTLETLQNRKGNIIIEKCLGKVIDSKGSGYLLNPTDPDHDYISYASISKANVGDIVETYFIYNPETNIEDDIIFRFDYITDYGK